MEARRLRVGVIGAGRMGERHSRVYSGLKGVEFVGVCDTSSERGRVIANAYGTNYFPECADLLRNVDAVSIATPTESHFDLASQCIPKGIHVLIEKPLSSTLLEAQELVRMASECAVVAQVGHIERFNPVFLELKGILEDLPVVALDIRRLSPFDTSNTDIDVVFDLMIHDIDIALGLLNDRVNHIHANGRPARTHGIDYAVASIAFDAGPLATLTASRVTEQKVRVVEITTLGAYIEADLLNKSISIYRRVTPEYISNHHKPLRYRQEGLVERIHIPTVEPLMLELQDFVRCVKEGRRPAVSTLEGMQAMEIATRVHEQIEATLGARSSINVGEYATASVPYFVPSPEGLSVA